MRRFATIVFLSSLVGFSACTEPPKPEKAKDLDKIKPKESDKKKSGGVELGELPKGPIAVVAGTEIPNAAFRSIYDLKVKKYADRGREIPPSADRRYRKAIAERLIYHEVLRQESGKQQVQYDEKALADREERQKRGIRDWDKHLERRGETEDSLKAMYIAELLETALLEKQGKLEVTEAEVEEEYGKIKGNYKADKDRVRASHILIPIGPGGERPTPEAQGKATDEEKKKWETEALAKANEVHKLATAPDADFAALAQEHSNGPSARKGGDIGIFTADRMVEEFSEVAFKLKPGQISKPVKTRFGFHIIKATGHWGPGELPRDALEDQIKERLRQRKLHRGKRELKEGLLAQYEIKDNIAPTLGPDPVAKRRAELKAKRAAADAKAGGAAEAKAPGKAPEGKADAKAPAGKPEGKADAKAEGKPEMKSVGVQDKPPT